MDILSIALGSGNPKRESQNALIVSAHQLLKREVIPALRRANQGQILICAFHIFLRSVELNRQCGVDHRQMGMSANHLDIGHPQHALQLACRNHHGPGPRRCSGCRLRKRC